MTITELIEDFQNTARLVAIKFYEKFGTEELLSAVIREEIPRQGSFGIIKNYSFHGCGLYVKLSKSEIDFDFGENNRIDGFDAWRLKSFAGSKSGVYSIFDTEQKIQIELNKFEVLGKYINRVLFQVVQITIGLNKKRFHYESVFRFISLNYDVMKTLIADAMFFEASDSSNQLEFLIFD